MDVQMPEMDGFEATAALRAREAGTTTHMPVVALTAHAMKGDRERCLAGGFDDYVSKPVQPDALFDAIDRVVRARPADGPEPAGAAALPAQSRSSHSGDDDVLDRAGLLARFDGDGDLLAELADLFRTSAPALVAEVRNAAARGDAPAMTRAAHTLRGMVGNFGAPRTMHLAQDIEDRGREGNLADAEARAADLERAVSHLAARLEALVAEVVP
jgi:CheY-like chemotaxis protein